MPLGDRPPEPLTAAEVRSLLDVCGTGVLGLRNRALVVTLWRAGLRCAEALALRPSDVDPAAGTIRVLHGKGRKARTVGIDPDGLAVLAGWLEARAGAGITDGPLFCSVRWPGRPLTGRYVRALMTRLGQRAGVGHRVHAHGLRHTHAVELAREGWPLALISRQLGHSNVGTTDTYLAGLHPAEVVTLARSRTWA